MHFLSGCLWYVHDLFGECLGQSGILVPLLVVTLRPDCSSFSEVIKYSLSPLLDAGPDQALSENGLKW